MIKQGTLLSELRSIAGKKHAREPKDDLECTVDGISPQVIVEPGTYEAVAEVLSFANARRLAVIPRGGGHQMQLGNLPRGYDVALSLARLDKVIDHEPADMTVTCQAGITIGVLNGQLTASGQMVPLSAQPDSADPRTVGGLLAQNMGDVRAAYGGARDFTIGMRVITADGRISKAGGKVVKNVAGYDLCKLYIGSRGTLVVIAEATFKLFPQPQVNETASFKFAACADACRVATEAKASGLSILDAHVIQDNDRSGDRTAGYLLYITCSGDPEAVTYSHQQVQEHVGRAGGTPFDRIRQGEEPISEGDPGYAEHPVSARVRLLPTQVPAFVEAMEERTEGVFDAAPLLGEVTWIWLKAGNQRAWVEAGQAAASRLGGTFEVQFCSPELKREIDVFGPPPPSFPLMRAVKQQFDPNNILSPGRFVGRL